MKPEREDSLDSLSASPSPTMLTPGTQLGPYKIEALLGAGGMGQVFRARDTRLGRTVAIKVLPHDRVADPERQRRFLQEARAASADHPFFSPSGRWMYFQPDHKNLYRVPGPVQN